MKACDRHARAEGALKAGTHRLLIANEAAEDPEQYTLLSEELCLTCVEDLVAWYRESQPRSAFMMLRIDQEEVAG